MGIEKKLIGKKVFIDTAPFIYYIENDKKYTKILGNIFDLNVAGEINFSTSVITLLELLIVPLKNNRLDLVEKYETIFSNSDTLELIEINIEISKLAAKYRSKYNFKTPDAIQLACAEFCDAEYFLTNDKQLNKQNNIQTIVLNEVMDN
ncbi:MAG: type II toxin-antitoxin system VapC family toxin [Bacteroidota bacterium]